METSAVKILSAVVVLWRFRARDAHEDAERQAARVAAALVVRNFCICRHQLRSRVCWAIANLSSTRYSRDRRFDRRRRRDAVAGQRETRRLSEPTASAALRADAASVGAVRLLVADRLGGTGDQRDLARKVGRPGWFLGGCAADPLGGVAKTTRQNLQLLLKRISPGEAISQAIPQSRTLGWLPPRRGPTGSKQVFSRN